ncbi:MAG: hypothetical protein WAL75_05310 [Terracidiphilus sp.]
MTSLRIDPPQALKVKVSGKLRWPGSRTLRSRIFTLYELSVRQVAAGAAEAFNAIKEIEFILTVGDLV